MSNKAKQRIRERMARTGESYCQALDAIRKGRPETTPTLTLTKGIQDPYEWTCDQCGQTLDQSDKSTHLEKCSSPESARTS